MRARLLLLPKSLRPWRSHLTRDPALFFVLQLPLLIAAGLIPLQTLDTTLPKGKGKLMS